MMRTRIREIIAQVDTFSKTLIGVSLLLALVYLLARGHSTFLSGSPGSIISVFLFLIGQIAIAVRSAQQRCRSVRDWRGDVLPTFAVVQKSLANNLVLLSGSESWRVAQCNPNARYPGPTGEWYRNGFRHFLRCIAPEDFGEAAEDEGEIPLVPRLRVLQTNVLVPMRDLVRWGLIIDRIYAESDCDRRQERLGLSVLELVLSLFTAESEQAIGRFLSGECIRVMPDDLSDEGVEFAGISYSPGKGGRSFQFAATANISEAADRLLTILNDICRDGHDLTFINDIPDYPFCRNPAPHVRDFCKAYLTMAWYRSVLNYIGWSVVERLDREETRRYGRLSQ